MHNIKRPELFRVTFTFSITSLLLASSLLLAETEVVMTTVISSHVKGKNSVFTGYQIFVTGRILVFHRCLYNNNKLTVTRQN